MKKGMKHRTFQDDIAPECGRVAVGVLAAVAGVCLGVGAGVVPAAAVAPTPGAGSSVAGAAVPAGLESFYGQTVEWYDCGATGGMERSAEATAFKCAKVKVPLDYSQPDGETIEIAMKKHVATGSIHRGSLFINPGGPGGSGVQYVEAAAETIFAGVQGSYDIVGFDPRGVGDSTPITCDVDGEAVPDGAVPGAMGADDPLPGPISADAAGADPTPFRDAQDPIADGAATGDISFQALVDEIIRDFTQKESQCSDGTKPVGLLDHVDTVSVARDLDVLRALSGNEKLDYLGASYGTYLGAYYAELFPANTGRMVLDGALDPSLSQYERRRGQAQGFEQALRNYVDWCQAGQDCPLTGGTDAGVQQIVDLIAAADQTPVASSDPNRPVTGQEIQTIVLLYLRLSEGSWTVLNTALNQAINQNDASTFRVLANETLSQSMVDVGVFYGNTCLDYRVEGDMTTWAAQSQDLEKVAPHFGTLYEGGDLTCQSWGHSGTQPPKALHAKGAAPILVIGTTGDPATPYEWSEALAEQLDSGQLLTWEGNGHTAYGNAGRGPCVANAVDTYLLTGAMPEKDLTCHGSE